MRNFKFVLAMTALTLSVSVARSEVQRGTGVPSAEDLKRQDWIDAGRDRFVKSCAFCHGIKGEAGKTAAFSTRRNWDPEVIFGVISEGRTNGSNVMPSWKGSIPDEQIWKIVAYIKSLSESENK